MWCILSFWLGVALSFECRPRVTLTTDCPDNCTVSLQEDFGSFFVPACIYYSTIERLCVPSELNRGRCLESENDDCPLQCIPLFQTDQFALELEVRVAFVSAALQDDEGGIQRDFDPEIQDPEPVRTTPVIIEAPLEALGEFVVDFGIAALIIQRSSFSLLSNDFQFQPAFLQNLESATRIDIENIAVGTQFDTLPLPNLLKLRLQNANLEQLPTDVILNAEAIAELDLSSNRLRTFPDIDFPVMSSLDLSNCSLNSIPTAVFRMPFLQSFSFRDNPITDFVVPEEAVEQLDGAVIEWDAEVPDCPVETESRSISNNVSICVPVQILSTNRPSPVPPTQPVVTSNAESSSTGLIVGLVVGGIALLTGIVVLVWYKSKSKFSKSKKMIDFYTLEEDDTVDATQYFYVSNDYDPSWSIDADQELLRCRIPYHNLVISDYFRKGGAGIVHRGQYQGEIVAIKSILRATISETQGFVHEIKLMSMLRHRNIVHFIGAAWTSSENISCITEWFEHGDLRSFVQTETFQDMLWNNDKIQMAEDIIKGVNYLHSRTQCIIHRDMKSKNVLVSNEFRLKLSDFGESKHRSFEVTATAGVGTVLWMAPEVIRGEQYDESVDIYSFGVILTELDTSKLPYHHVLSRNGQPLSSVGLAHAITYQGLTARVSSSCPAMIKSLAEDCMNPIANERPNALEILKRLTKARSAFIEL